MDADFHTKGPNPWLDMTRYGGYIGPNYNAAATTCSISASSTTATCASASDFVNGNGIFILGAGPAPVIATPQAPTVTPYFQGGSTTRNYCVTDRDWAGGLTPCGPVGTTTTAPASMALANYSIASWNFNTSTHTYTLTTSAAHNMPTTASPISSEPYAQVEIQSGSANSGICEGAYSLTAVPSATTLQFQRNELVNDPGCSGGTLRIQPKIVVTWASSYAYAVQSASCSGGTATIAITPGLNGPSTIPGLKWVVPGNQKMVIAGVADTHYNGNYTMGGFGTGQTTVTYSLGSCTGVTNVGAGGTLSIVPGKAVKNHLIYECTGAACALPANAANYSIVGVATGNDNYFEDKGWAVLASAVDTGAPSTAPTSAINEYLDTTISSGGGATSLTLAAAAATSVTNVGAWHDNVPNLLEACAALPASPGNSNSGHILVPASTSLFQYFPMIANFDMTGSYGTVSRNCPAGTTIDFGAIPYLDGAILPGKATNFQGGYGGTNCGASFYEMSAALTCLSGYSYPMIYFEPEQASANYFANLVLTPNQAYQSGLYIDQQMDTDGTTGLHFYNVHVNGGIHAYPVVDKAGFGQFWDYGGWSATGGNFAESRDFIIQPNCAGAPYQPTNPVLPYIVTTNNTYHFGTMQISSCGLSTGIFGSNVTFNNMLTEGPAGPAFKVNLLPYGLSSITFNQASYSDYTGGSATPYFDLTNSGVNSADFNYTACANGWQPLLETNSAISYNGIHVKLSQGGCSAGVGYPAGAGVVYENLTNNQWIWNGTQLSIGGAGKISAGQIVTPGVAPSVSASTSCSGIPVAGTYTYGVVAWDASSNPLTGTGGATKAGPASSGVSLNGTTQCAVISQPTLPAGTAYWAVVRVSGPAASNVVWATGSYCSNGAGFIPVSTTTIIDQSTTVCGSQPSINTTSLQIITTSGVYGNLTGSTIGTFFNCNSTASPAVCGSAPTGLVQVAAAATTLTVNTTAVTANSRFALTYVTTGAGCTPAPGNIASLLPPYVSGIGAGTSFTMTLPVAPTTNAACISYTIEN